MLVRETSKCNIFSHKTFLLMFCIAGKFFLLIKEAHFVHYSFIVTLNVVEHPQNETLSPDAFPMM